MSVPNIILFVKSIILFVVFNGVLLDIVSTYRDSKLIIKLDEFFDENHLTIGSTYLAFSK